MASRHAGSGAQVPEVPEPSLAERARTLAAIGRIGSLSTHSEKFPGFPFGSMMPYAIDHRGRPIFFISSMAMHTHNLERDERSSLLVTQPDTEGDPLGAARMTLVGRSKPVPPAEASELYLTRHENARQWQDFADFAYYRLEVEGVYFIGGFGVMGWITDEEYAAAAPDPLAEAGPGIMRHMNMDHAKALRRIAAHLGGEMPEEAVITAIDRLGFHLRLKSGERVYGGRFAFPREVRNAPEAREAFIEMLRAMPAE